MDKINRQAKTVGRWEEILMPIEVEALHDTYHTNPEEVLTPDEVLDIIVEWEGALCESNLQFKSYRVIHYSEGKRPEVQEE